MFEGFKTYALIIIGILAALVLLGCIIVLGCFARVLDEISDGIEWVLDKILDFCGLLDGVVEDDVEDE